MLVLHSRLVAPLGPCDGISFPYSCYIYDCSYLRGPQRYSMCFENPQHPPLRKAHGALGQDIIASTTAATAAVLAHLLYVCVFCPCDLSNLSKYVSECFQVSASPFCSPPGCLNACGCFYFAVYFCLCVSVCLRVVVFTAWSDRASV